VPQTIQETIKELHGALRDYIEATYHISSPALIEQRKELLNRSGVVFQDPYIESTPRYQTGKAFASIPGLSDAALQVFTALSSQQGQLEKLLYDPPYKHQSEAIDNVLVKAKNLLVMTGTGSGKTESFLLPILGKFATEAKKRPKVFFEQPAMRALILYPMNALVNDQLGRMRGLFGDPRTAGLFKKWSGRPARFARYTSRTPYAGVRSRKNDQRKLKAFEEFYVDIERAAKGAPSDEQREATSLIDQLRKRGKWPAKPDLVEWYGDKGEAWQDKKTEEFKRAITLPDDVELITRSEVQAAPPDLLVTNYSMLEYMLMRPIERSIFDSTKNWLHDNKDEKFLVVLDEAHLYRGASGAEVGLLLRRLRDRLDIPPERFQVICATASFNDKDYAPHFGAQLSGVPAETFVAITGDLDLKSHEAVGSRKDAEVLAGIDLMKFHEAETPGERDEIVRPLLKHLGGAPTGNLEEDLYKALANYPPLGLLINTTMKQARAVSELGRALFPDAPQHADLAVTALMLFGSMARPDAKSPGLLPCRIHNFFRGLPGLWACMDPACSFVSEDERSGICGKLFSQPRERCDCGARVHQFYTCRACGTAYARTYTDDVDTPSALWSEPGRQLRVTGEEAETLLPLDLLLEQPRPGKDVELASYDLETGRLNPTDTGPRTRNVFLRCDRVTPAEDEEDGEIDNSIEARGQFVPCACCNKTQRGRTTVQDHQTKGDEPFQALVARQIQIQPPNAVKATRFAPLRGRKVLVFSDSRQVAARLAPNLQMYSTRDSLRPLIAWGYTRLQQSVLLNPHVGLNDLYLAVLLASKKLTVRLRPELASGENFAAEEEIANALANGTADTDTGLLTLMLKLRSSLPPRALLEDIVATVQNPFLGLEALALASLCERSELTPRLEKLRAIPGLAETPEAKISLARAWLRCWRNNGFWLAGMPSTWQNRSRTEGVSVKDKKGKGKFRAMDVIITDKPARKIFNDHWTPDLLSIFAVDLSGAYQLRGGELSLAFDGKWVRCSTCKSVHRPVENVHHCLDCGSDDIAILNPDTDPVFLARKGYYRRPVMAALAQPPREPMALIAAEHTAQLNAPQNEDVFSKAEENELLFQDVLPAVGRVASKATAIDVLSSTTTMEVGIDIGALSGVALRNMPPGRANYQQRAGRAGRRGNAVATVVAFGSADSHDEHYFVEPQGMIRGDVVDPRLTLDNREITRRHIRAFLLQSYHQDRLPDVDPSQPHKLFSVLGTVADFREGTAVLNLPDFKNWIAANEERLKERVADWMPSELSAEDRDLLLSELKRDCIAELEAAVAPGPGEAPKAKAAERDDDDDEEDETPSEEGDERPGQKPKTDELLQRLLYKGILPRYAFPTDVAAFHVFDVQRSTRFRPIMRFAPSQGLPIALTQYAPGKQIWISGKSYSSGAIYSSIPDERFQAWESKRLYAECSSCGFARTYRIGEAERGQVQDCPACGTAESFGPARFWLRPPGFAHPVDVEEVTSPEDMPETSYATRAKLTMATPNEEARWNKVNSRVRIMKERNHLLVSNTGPKDDGYSYCVKCGRIEASSEQSPRLSAPHRKPYPDDREPICEGNGTTRHIVLGTDFITDIALLSMDVEAPLRLKPGLYPTDVALRTVSEAIAKAGSQMLEIEPGELMAEYRPSLTQEGRDGLKAEIFLYDTLPGGAGFSSQLVEHGAELLKRALDIVKACPENCDASCYRCLRSFKNKFEHKLLDRHVGRELLEYLITGQLPQFDAERLKSSTALLFKDLARQGDAEISYRENVTLGGMSAPILAMRRDGAQYFVALSGPLTEGHPADERLTSLAKQKGAPELVVINELLVRGNLPAATAEVQGRIKL
jgi:ATP-dependent helicase YprA (DUF1998 family)/Zn finger protein HypA/HybF involved in hydrogenase expression